jgi:hypothetical protein
VHSPVQGHDLDVDKQSYNMLLSAVRATRERANAGPKGRLRCLRKIRLRPTRIGAIVAAAIVLSTLQRGTPDKMSLSYSSRVGAIDWSTSNTSLVADLCQLM